MKNKTAVEKRLIASGYNLDKGYAPKADIISKQRKGIALALNYLEDGATNSCKAILKSLLA